MWHFSKDIWGNRSYNGPEMVMFLMGSRNRKEAIVAITGSAIRSLNNWIAFPLFKNVFWNTYGFKRNCKDSIEVFLAPFSYSFPNGYILQ